MKYLGLLFAIIGILMIISGAIASNIMYANLKKENQQLKEINKTLANEYNKMKAENEALWNNCNK